MITSLKSRLRIGLVFCLTCIFFATYSEWRQLNGLATHTAVLEQQTTPLLSRVAAFSQQAVLVPKLVQDINAAQNQEQLDITAQLASDLIQNGAAELDQTDDDSEQMRGQFAAALNTLTQVRSDEIKTKQHYDVKTADMRRSLASLSRQIDHLMLNARIDYVTAARAVQGVGLKVETKYADKVLALADLDSDLVNLALLAGYMELTSMRAVLQQRPQFSSRILVFSSRVERLPNAAAKTALMNELNTLRTALFSETGVFETAKRLNALSDVQEQAGKAVLPLGLAFSSRVDGVSQKVAQDFQDAAHVTGRTTNHAIAISLILNILLIAMSILLLFLVFERIVISRITRLSDHIRDMSQGTLTQPVMVQGEDEIGVLEGAVERSRLTAIELRQSNEELQRFAYIAAHDLRTPLRAVSNLVDWTIEDFGKDLPEEVQLNLNIIDGRVDRLSRHLADLLEYARAGQSIETFGLFDMNAIIDTIVTDHLRSGMFEVVLTGAPDQFETFVTPLHTILLNLMSNAMKHHDKDSGTIFVDVSVENTQLCIEVRDDGPGIALEYQDRVFELFQTIQSRDRVEGSGLGLALVQKLTHSLGGEVVLQSDPSNSRGTTFSIYLPERSWRYPENNFGLEAAE